MSCVTCDGKGAIPPPENKPWLLTGEEHMACPVCRGPHLRWLMSKLAEDGEITVECSHETCDKEIMMGWLVYAQLTSSRLPKLDEELSICCDEHSEAELVRLRNEGHATVCLPFCLSDIGTLV